MPVNEPCFRSSLQRRQKKRETKSSRAAVTQLMTWACSHMEQWQTATPLTLYGIQSSRLTKNAGSDKGIILATIAFKCKWQWLIIVLWQWCRILFSFYTPSLPRPLSLPHSTSNKPVWVIAGKTAPRCASPPDTESPLANHSDAEERSWRKMLLRSIHSRALLYKTMQLMRENPKVRSHELKKHFASDICLQNRDRSLSSMWWERRLR